jgi:hypothetical protein
VNTAAISSTSIATGIGVNTTGALQLNVFSGMTQIGAFVITASGNNLTPPYASVTFSTTQATNGITSDGAGLWYADGGGMSNQIYLSTPNQNYTNGAPVCFKVA